MPRPAASPSVVYMVYVVNLQSSCFSLYAVTLSFFSSHHLLRAPFFFLPLAGEDFPRPPATPLRPGVGDLFRGAPLALPKASLNARAVPAATPAALERLGPGDGNEDDDGAG